MPYYVWIILGCALAFMLLAIAITFYFKKKNKKPKLVIDDAFINELVQNYGSLENIKSVNVDNGRLKIEVADLDKVNLEGLKALSTGGLFVTGNIIKTLYKLDSKTIKDKLDKMR